MIKAFCDKCQHEITNPPDYRVLPSGWDKPIDLCHACFTRALEWLKTHPAAEPL